MHQAPVTAATPPVDHSAHRAPEAPKPGMPGRSAEKVAAGCCGGEMAGEKPTAKMDCCAGMGAKDDADAKPCEHCAAKAAGDTASGTCCAAKPKP
jgi:hypothetical protein